jgi:hypothetical protein
MHHPFRTDVNRVLRSEQGRKLLEEARRLASTPASKARIDDLRRRLESTATPRRGG